MDNQKIEKKEIAPLELRSIFKPETVDEAARTIEVVATTSAPVLRQPWWGDDYNEELSMDLKHIRMERFKSGAPVLDAHMSYGLRNQIGVVEKSWVEGSELRSLVRFPKAEDDVEADKIFRKVKDGIIRNVSIGYRVYKYEDVTLPGVDGKKPEIRNLKATDWEPHELSFVPIPADFKAGSRSMERNEKLGTNNVEIVFRTLEVQQNEREINMDPKVTETNVADAGASKEELKRAQEEGAKQERSRVSEITRCVKAAGLEESVASEMIAKGTSIEEARSAIFDKLAEKSATPAKPNASVTVTRDETDTFRKATEEALLHRASPGRNKLTDMSRNHAGYSLREIARQCVERQGIKTGGMSPMDIVERAFQSTSDFPAILANAMNKSLRAAYNEAGRSFLPWATRGSAPDFKQISRTQLSNFPSLTKVNEGGEVKHYAVEDGKEVYSLSTYAAIVGFTRQAIINDDLSALERLPAGIGMAAAGLESDLVYAILTANAALQDTGLLFNATAVTTVGGHANYKATGGGAPDATTVAAGKAAMRLQKGSGANSARVLNIVPKFLIVPAALELKAQQLCVLSNVPDAITNGNPFKGNMDVIVEARLDAASAVAWYLAAAPGLVDTVEYCYLEGQEGVYTETKQGFDVDGVQIKARHDFAAKALDFRGLYKNVGQ